MRRLPVLGIHLFGDLLVAGRLCVEYGGTALRGAAPGAAPAAGRARVRARRLGRGGCSDGDRGRPRSTVSIDGLRLRTRAESRPRSAT